MASNPGPELTAPASKQGRDAGQTPQAATGVSVAVTPTVLVCSSEFEIRHWFFENLCEMGVHVNTADDGKEAYALLKGTLYHVLIVDAGFKIGRKTFLRFLSQEADLDSPPTTIVAVRPGIQAEEYEAYIRLGLLPCIYPARDLKAYINAAVQQTTTRQTLRNMQAGLRRAYSEMKKMAERDRMTDMYDHERFYRVLGQEAEKASQDGKKLSLLLMDIDKFKRVNDTQGHPAGDRAILSLAEVIKATIRSEPESQDDAERRKGGIDGHDVAGRLGGDEFAVLLEGASIQSAVAAGNRIRAAFTEKTGGLSVSVGAAEIQKQETAESFLARTDRALYASKHHGRNAVTAWTQEIDREVREKMNQEAANGKGKV